LARIVAFYRGARLMKAHQCRVRLPAALIAAAAIFVCGTAPVIGAETAYLMYLRGSEGPPATPLRVLWDEVDDANARIEELDQG
jgi:hypothetical protein